jgi:hypothetical protein
VVADWPDADEVKRVLDVTSDDWDDTLERVRLAAIAKVKADVGEWDEDADEPDESLAQAALRMAELISLRPEAAIGTISDPTYNRLLYGHRRTFGIA